MRWKFLVLSIFLIAVNGRAQIIDRIFGLPDTAPDIEWVANAGVSPVSGRVYFGEIEEWLHIFDPSALQKHGFLPVTDRITDIEICPAAHRIWAVDWEKTLLGFDDSGDTLVYRIENFGISPFVLQYNPLLNHLYVGDSGILVVEPQTGILLDTIPTSGGYVRRLAFDPHYNYLFSAPWGNGPVEVIDCNARVAIGTLSGTEHTSDLAVHPTEPKLYCLIGWSNPNRQVLKVVDIDSLAVTESIPIPIGESWEEYGRIFVNRVLNRLYCLGMWNNIDRKCHPQWTWDTLAIIDISADTLVKMLGLPELQEDVRGAVVNQITGKLYLACPFSNRVFVVDDGDSICRSISAEWPTDVAWDSVHNRLCVAADGAVLVIDGETDSIIHIEDYYGLPPVLMHYNEISNCLYIFNWRGVGRVVNDTIQHFTPFWYLTCFYAPYSWELNRYYLLADTGDGQYVFAYDCATDSVVAGFPHYGCTVFTLIPETHLLYAQSDTTHIYDILRDSLIAGRTGFPRIAVYNPHTSATYGYNQNLLAVLNQRGDSVERWVPLEYVIDNIIADTAANHLWIESGGRLFAVFNCSTLQVVDTLRINEQGFRSFWIDPERKIYVFTRDSLLVISAEQRRIIKRIPISSRITLAEYDRYHNRLYLFSWDDLIAFDCHNDSLCWLVSGLDFDRSALNPLQGEFFGAKRKKVTVIKDLFGGITERDNTVIGTRSPRIATLFRNVLKLENQGLMIENQHSVLIDITGRRVMELMPGANDIRHLAPGVYFLWSADKSKRLPLAKVVVTK